MTISLHKNCIPFLFSNVYKTKAIHFFNGQQTCLKYDRKHKIIREIIIKFHTMEQMVNLLQRAVCNDLFYLFLKIILTRAEHNLFFITQGGYSKDVLRGQQIMPIQHFIQIYAY